MQTNHQSNPISPEAALLPQLIATYSQELRANRRWKIISKLLSFVLFIGILILFVGLMFSPDESLLQRQEPHLALIRFNGVIASGGDVSAARINTALRHAFEDEKSKAVVLLANSPGGSPVQAGMISDEILYLRKLYPNKPIYTVTEEVCASGCYYVAAVTDKIYANKASMIGSIGVIMEGFGFNRLIDTLGVDRRVITAGENKAILDPFSPQRESDKVFFEAMIKEVHQQFIDVVKLGRGDRLKQDDPSIFSGLVWTGETAIGLGLIDGLSSLTQLSRDEFNGLEYVDYSIQDSLEERLAQRLGASVSKELVNSLSETAAPVFSLR